MDRRELLRSGLAAVAVAPGRNFLLARLSPQTQGKEKTGSGASYRIEVAERDGFARRSFPTEVEVRFSPGDVRSAGPLSLFYPPDELRPAQISVIDSWEDGSVRKARLWFRSTIGGRETKIYRVLIGEARSFRNPLTRSAAGGSIRIQQGPVVYSMRSQNFNLIDEVSFREQPFHKPGGRGFLLVIAGKELSSRGRTEFRQKLSGPLVRSFEAEAPYPEGMSLGLNISFFSGKSWVGVRHQLAEDVQSAIEGVVFETRFFFAEDLLSTTFGSGERYDGATTSWAILTDRHTTVEVANAVSGSESVLYEVGKDGLFRAFFQPDSEFQETYIHYLIGPPDNQRNTPAAAMLSPLYCSVRRHSGNL